MTLSRLKRSNKEMAGTLGVGIDTIRKYRSRLRKKLNFSGKIAWRNWWKLYEGKNIFKSQ